MEQWVIRSLTDRFPIRSGLTVLWITVGELSNFLLSAAVFFFRDLKMFFVTMQCLLVYEGFYYIYLCGTISYLQLILNAFFFSSFYFAWVGFVAFFFTALANSNRHKLIAFFGLPFFMCSCTSCLMFFAILLVTWLCDIFHREILQLGVRWGAFSR